MYILSFLGLCDWKSLKKSEVEPGRVVGCVGKWLQVGVGLNVRVFYVGGLVVRSSWRDRISVA